MLEFLKASRNPTHNRSIGSATSSQLVPVCANQYYHASDHQQMLVLRTLNIISLALNLSGQCGSKYCSQLSSESRLGHLSNALNRAHQHASPALPPHHFGPRYSEVATRCTICSLNSPKSREHTLGHCFTIQYASLPLPLRLPLPPTQRRLCYTSPPHHLHRRIQDLEKVETTTAIESRQSQSFTISPED